MAQHKDEWGAGKAIEVYTRILDNYAADLSSRWLLNIAYMQIGEYPDKVPAAYLIPPESFKTEFETPRFNNIAGNLGVDYADMCGSIIMEDFNNDGYTDIFQGGWGLNEQVHYLINKGDGSFEDVSEKAGLNKYPGGLMTVSYTHLRAHETVLDLVCRLLLEKKKTKTYSYLYNQHNKTHIL
mgnify:CR=1 FL=1